MAAGGCSDALGTPRCRGRRASTRGARRPTEVVEARYDLVLPVVNEHGARPFLHVRGEQVLLHATTSRARQAQLHRHRAGRDEALCRTRTDDPFLTMEVL